MRDPRFALLIPVLLLAVWPAIASGQDWKRFRAARQAGDLEALSVELGYGAGRLSVAPAENGWLYDVRMRYDASRFVPVRSWKAEEERGLLRVHLTSAEEDDDAPLEIDLNDFDLDVDLKDLQRLGDASGELELRLGTRVPTALELVVGASESSLELGGIPLTNVDVATGASDTRLSFDAPNPVNMDRLVLRTGAAAFRATDLGNARFERLEFRGGVGDVTLDFRGDWTRDASASVSMGVGSLKVRVPATLGVEVRKKSFLTAFSASGFERVGDAWRTENWSEAEHRLQLEVDAAFGSIDIDRLP